MIGKNISINLDGVLFTAFNLHCLKKGYQNSAEAVRDMIRELPEFKELENSNKSEQQSQEKNVNMVKISGEENDQGRTNTDS